MFHQPSPEEIRRNQRESIALEVAEAAHNLASIARSGYERIWSGDFSQVVADLNADLTNALAMMQSNTALASVINPSLDLVCAARPDLAQKFSARIPSTLPPSITFDGEQFVYSPPTAPEPEESPQAPE